MSRAMRWSCETAALRETPFGSPPSYARERRKVVRLESAWAKALPAGSTTAHRSAAASIRRGPCMLFLIGTDGHALSRPCVGLDASRRAGFGRSSARAGAGAHRRVRPGQCATDDRVRHAEARVAAHAHAGGEHGCEHAAVPVHNRSPRVTRAHEPAEGRDLTP